MPAEATIRIEAENKTQQAFRQVDQSLESLDQQTRAVQSSTRQSAAALGLVGSESRESAVGVTSLGRSIFPTPLRKRSDSGVSSRTRQENYAKQTVVSLRVERLLINSVAVFRGQAKMRGF